MLIDQKFTIHKALPDVWRTVTDFEQYPRWQSATRLARVTPNDPIRTGSMLYIEQQGLFGPTFINADLVEFQRSKVIDMKGVYGRFRFRRTIEFSSAGRETTIRDRIEMNPGCLYFWYTPLLHAQLSGQMKRDWNTLKQQLEAQNPSASLS